MKSAAVETGTCVVKTIEYLLIGLVFGSVILAAATSVCQRYKVSRAQGRVEPVVVGLVNYQTSGDAYPSALSPEQQKVIENVGYAWYYSASDDGKSCYLSVGDYADDGFTAYWSSENGAWRVDE